MTLYRTAIRASAVEILALRIQNVRVLTGQQWSIGVDQLPALLVDMREESKVARSGNNGPPSYDVTASMVVRARAVVPVHAGAALHGVDHGPAAEAVLDAWLHAIQEALLGEASFVSRFSAIPTVRVETQVVSDASSMIAEAGVTFEMTWIEEYPPRIDDALATVSLRVDAIDPFDPAGNYGAILNFPAPSAPPRLRGPDGRVETGLDISLPQP